MATPANATQDAINRAKQTVRRNRVRLNAVLAWTADQTEAARIWTGARLAMVHANHLERAEHTYKLAAGDANQC